MILNTTLLNRIYIRTISKEYYEQYTHKYQKDKYYQHVFTNPYLSQNFQDGFYFACYKKTNNHFIGCMSGFRVEKTNIFWIQTFLINRDYIRQKYGSEFFLLFMNQLISNFSIDKICLSCLELNYKGTKFWEKLGFTTIQKRKKSFGNKLKNVIIYEKEVLTKR